MRGSLCSCRGDLSPYRAIQLFDPITFARQSNARFVPGFACFHIKQLMLSKAIHDVVNENRSHFQGVRRGYFSSQLNTAEGVCVHSASHGWELKSGSLPTIVCIVSSNHKNVQPLNFSCSEH